MLLAFAITACAQQFVPQTIATGLKGGYQVVIADLNHDGKPDIIALASGMTELVWYENPKWERHVLATGLRAMINCAVNQAADEIVIAWEFSNESSRSIGKVGVLRPRGDPRDEWGLTEIDALSTSHRIRWADLDGNGKPVAVNAPLTNATAKGPLYEGRTPLVFYRSGQWKRIVLNDANEGVQHGIFVTRWAATDTRDSILTASFSGIDLLRWQRGAWTRTELSKAAASDVAIGHLGKLRANKQRFLASIEPWHGNQVAVYAESGQNWDRLQIDDSLKDGHTILTADFDGDGNDEIVVGARQGAKGVSLYKWDGMRWQKRELDVEGLGPAACAAAVLNIGGAVDLVCIGSSSETLRLYRNITVLR